MSAPSVTVLTMFTRRWKYASSVRGVGLNISLIKYLVKDRLNALCVTVARWHTNKKGVARN